ncbi:GntR family transcriptional regulator [Limnoglobus roseus]|uniref:GntR family transcriptional regulator n=2 Tax=Limnoglobus roseus TaxID=2598579 RepID=A0A5C1AQD5_9BACT|nr:GntR family transcriptional regulator [Limnoglobus roseus]
MLADVFNGRLAAGQHLIGQKLADHYRVSQTPIREALITLAGIGVIDLLPNRGAVVRRMTEQDVREVCQIRRVLECEAVRTACGRVKPEAWADITKQVRDLQTKLGQQPGLQLVRQAKELDSQLHDAIAAACGNRLLAREIERLKLLFRAYRDASWVAVAARNEFHRLEAEAAEHLILLGHLHTENAPAAADAMATHITSGENYWTAAVFGHNKPD